MEKPRNMPAPSSKREAPKKVEGIEDTATALKELTFMLARFKVLRKKITEEDREVLDNNFEKAAVLLNKVLSYWEEADDELEKNTDGFEKATKALKKLTFMLKNIKEAGEIASDEKVRDMLDIDFKKIADSLNKILSAWRRNLAHLEKKQNMS